jgi:hypothetical protein
MSGSYNSSLTELLIEEVQLKIVLNQEIDVKSGFKNEVVPRLVCLIPVSASDGRLFDAVKNLVNVFFLQLVLGVKRRKIRS